MWWLSEACGFNDYVVCVHAASSLVHACTCIVNDYRNLYKCRLYISWLHNPCTGSACMKFFDILAILYFKLSMATHSHLLDNSCIYEILVCIKSCIYTYIAMYYIFTADTQQVCIAVYTWCMCAGSVVVGPSLSSTRTQWRTCTVWWQVRRSLS